ncbi:MAG: hypothetical protein DYG92_03450 [Leptolyngbya sp. PLA1]|nr:hypothetical protein [Leptolyngbya sp. PLA1]
MQRLSRRGVLASCLTMVLTAASCTRSAPPPQAAAPVPLDLSGAVVIGASVSDGFGAMLPGEEPKGLIPQGVPLARTLGSIAHTHAAPASHSSSLFFMSPEQEADSQLAAAQAARPALVFAIDYLFWHAYGEMDDSAREAALQRGLDRLSKLEAPIILADLPDMTHAVGIMLSSRQVPSPRTLEALNARIRDWAAARPNAVIVPLAGVVRSAMASGQVHVGGRDYQGQAARDLLTRDGLHATLDGQIAVALEALSQAKAAGVLPSNATWDSDPAAILARLASPAPGRP